MPSNKTKMLFASILFNDDELRPVVISQYHQGLGIGTTLVCDYCLLDVDRLLDNPTKHQEICKQNLIIERINNV